MTSTHPFIPHPLPPSKTQQRSNYTSLIIHPCKTDVYLYMYVYSVRVSTCRQIQDIHKRMVRFQKLTRNLFLALHRHNVHRQQRQLSKFLMLTAGPISKMASQQEKAFCVLRFEVSRSVIIVHETHVTL